MTRNYTGIDGCRGGWLAVTLKSGNTASFFEARLFAAGDHPALAELCDGSELVLIDIPVGLPDGNRERESDRLVRRGLGKKGSSIFPVPSRDAVYAEDYETACMINLEQKGKKISKQAWNLIPKIKDVDLFLRNQPGCRKMMRESSPEYAFELLAGSPLTYKKTEQDGIEERLALCVSRFASAKLIFDTCMNRFLRKACAPHDILDSLVLALSAEGAAAGRRLEMPAEPEYDRFGIPMQAVFAQ